MGVKATHYHINHQKDTGRFSTPKAIAWFATECNCRYMNQRNSAPPVESIGQDHTGVFDLLLSVLS